MKTFFTNLIATVTGSVVASSIRPQLIKIIQDSLHDRNKLPGDFETAPEKYSLGELGFKDRQRFFALKTNLDDAFDLTDLDGTSVAKPSVGSFTAAQAKEKLVNPAEGITDKTKFSDLEANIVKFLNAVKSTRSR